MEKILILVLTLILAFSLAACGDKGNTPGDGFGDITIPGDSSSSGATNNPGDTSDSTQSTESQPQQPSGGRTLSATEKELVGTWAHGSVDLGFWKQYDQGAYTVEEYRPSSGAGGIVYTFNDDGTYSKHSWVNSTSVGQTSSLETGNWVVIEDNTIQFSNKFVVYYEDFKNPSNSYKNREWEERWGGYILYYVRSDSIEYGYEGFFFHDSNLDFILERAAIGNYSAEYYRKRD